MNYIYEKPRELMQDMQIENKHHYNVHMYP